MKPFVVLLLLASPAVAQMHVGDTQLGRQVSSPLSVTNDVRSGDAPANALVVQCKSGIMAMSTTQTIGSDQVGVSSWCYRGEGSWSPLYGANIGVVFTTPGQTRALELDVNNYGADAGPDAYGEHVGLWINRSGPYHNSSAIEVSTQDERGWYYGIHFDAGINGPSLGTGIHFDGSNASHFVTMRPYDDTDNDAITLSSASGEHVKAIIRKRGAFGARGDSTGPMAPAFYFIDNERTGLYQPAPGQLGVSLNGSPVFKVTHDSLVYRDQVGRTMCINGMMFTAGLMTGGC